MTMVTVTHECCTNHDADLHDLGSSSSPPVSRGCEGEEGVLDEALVIALKNQRDRQFLLKLDRELCSFLMNKSQDRLELPWGNSYYRMMIHRSAIYFQLARKVEPLLKKIILSKTECSAIPTLRFSDLVEEEPDEEMDDQERQTNKAEVD
ncbi:R3H domain-containing protein 1, partial [Dissophora globulifera]